MAWQDDSAECDKVLEALRALDTPTVCNALERVIPERRGHGFTTSPLVCLDPAAPPMVGWARTATIRAMQPSGRDPEAQAQATLAYYEHAGQSPHPTITVIQDLDPAPGAACFWGEVHSAMHRGLGSLGVITNGTIRDLDDWAEGFQALSAGVAPSHAFVHIVDCNIQVEVHGMCVKPGDLIHADQHGAVVIPTEVAEQVPEAAAQVAKQESLLIEASQKPGFNVEKIKAIFTGTDDH